MITRYNYQKRERLESPPEVEAFLDDLGEVFLKHRMTIAHEDGHGAFIIEGFDEYNIKWLRHAGVDIK